MKISDFLRFCFCIQLAFVTSLESADKNVLRQYLGGTYQYVNGTRKSLNSNNVLIETKIFVNCIITYLESVLHSQNTKNRMIYGIANLIEMDEIEQQFFKTVNEHSNWLVQILSVNNESNSDIVENTRDFLKSERNIKNFVCFISAMTAKQVLKQLYGLVSKKDFVHIILTANEVASEMNRVVKLIFVYFKNNANIITQNQNGSEWHVISNRNHNCPEGMRNFEIIANYSCNKVSCSSSWTNEPYRPLKVGSINWEPFMYYDKSMGFYKGIDYFLTKTIAEYLNISITFVSYDLSEYPEINDTVEIYDDLLNG